jgi:hypothetical protein
MLSGSGKYVESSITFGCSDRHILFLPQLARLPVCLELDPLLGLFMLAVLVMLAVLANVAYCAAYPVDVFVQMSGLRETWRSSRWVLFLIGMIFAGILTRWIALGTLGLRSSTP